MTNPDLKYPELAHKPETKLKIAASLRGKKKTAKTKALMRKARLRYPAKLEADRLPKAAAAE